MRFIKAAAAAVLIALLVVGIPLGLIAIVGNPFDPSVWGAPVSNTMIIKLIGILVWLFWAQMTGAFAVELVNQIRDLRGKAPTLRAPAFGGQQRLAHLLISAVIAAGAASTIAGPALAAPAHASPAPTSTTTSATAAARTHTPATTYTTAGNQAQAPASAGHKVATVARGDSLWRLAQQHLGSGTRWREIAELNQGRDLGDGTIATSGVLADQLQPGWQLVMPADATGLPSAAQAAHGYSYTVKAGDDLTQIAEDHLGNANRYHEIFEASRHITQPDGKHLSDPNLIEPGWTLHIPTTNADASSTTAPQSAPHHSATQSSTHPGTTQPSSPAGSDSHTGQTPGSAAASTQAGEQNQQPSSSNTPAPAPAASQGHTTAGNRSTTSPHQQTANARAEVNAPEDAFSARTIAGVGALLAAGIIGLIAYRRTRQQRRRRPGAQIPMPEGDTLVVEEELRTVADPMSVETVDRALRSVAATCAREHTPLPKIRAARLTATGFDLYLDEPATLPAPWVGTADGTVWTLADQDAADLPAVDVDQVAAPYPSLVTIGHDAEDGHILLDLEYLGALGITGAEETTRQVLAAIAVELATSRWADDLQVTIVGAYAELASALETGRVRYLPTAGRLLDDLAKRAERDREALAADGAPDLNTARVTGAAPGTWTPEIVLVAGDLTTAQQERLQALVTELPRVAVAAITSGAAVGEWALEMDKPGEGRLEPYGLTVRPQLLDDDTYAHVLQILATADDDAPTTTGQEWAPEPTLEDVDRLTDAEDTGQQTPGSAGHGDVDDAEDAAARLHAVEAEHPGQPPEQEQAPGTGDTSSVDEPTTTGADADDGGHLVELPATSDLESEGEAPELPAAEKGRRSERDEPTGAEEKSVEAADAPPVPASTDATSDNGTTEPASDATPADAVPDEHSNDEPAAKVTVMPTGAPRILMLGPVQIVDAAGTPPESSRRARLTELASILVTHPGCDHTTIDACYYPGKLVTEKTRNPQVSKLRRWLGKTPDGEDYLPVYQAGARYTLHPDVASDWDHWQTLLPDGAAHAPTEALASALELVRGTPFEGVRERYYTWAEALRQQMIAAIVDASYELARRRLMDGRWAAAEEAALAGLRVEPGMENLWRMRLQALHARGNTEALERAIGQLLDTADGWGGDLEEETNQLLAQLRQDPPARASHLAGTR